MGQQQLMLIIIGTLIVIVAVALSITMFLDNAVTANRDAVTNDLLDLAARAQTYYRRPKYLVGGGNNFTGLTMGMLSNLAGSNSSFNNVHGTFYLGPISASTVIITGVGTERNGDGNLVSVEIHISPAKMDTAIVLQ